MANTRVSGVKALGVVRLIFGLLGLAFLLLALGFYLSSTTFSSFTGRTQGTITDLVANNNGRGGLAPVVGYTVAGQAYTYRSDVNSSLSLFKVGDQVIILYQPNNPQNAEIEGYSVGLLLALIFGIIGLVFIVVSLVISVVRFILRRQRR